MDRLVDLVRANPIPFVGLGFLVVVVVLWWVVESSSFRYRHH